MVGHYQSDNEREFFEKQRYKEEYVVTISNDLVLHEDNNEDKIYIVRCWFCEYVVGGEGYLKGEEHYMNLSETLNANLQALEFRVVFGWKIDLYFFLARANVVLLIHTLHIPHIVLYDIITII